MKSALLPRLRRLTVAALLLLLVLVGLITTGAGLHDWAWPAETVSDTTDVALGHRPQPPPPPRGSVL